MQLIISLVFSEITLKGGNRKSFENLLIRNIRFALSSFQFSIENTHRRLVLSFDGDVDNEQIKNSLSHVFGIDYLSVSHVTKPNLEAIVSFVENNLNTKGRSIKVVTKRSDKSFPLISQQVSASVGAALVKKGFSVDLHNPDQTIFIDILKDRALISFDKVKCYGGLPVKASGSVLSLLSGGLDSPVASWFMMKRGCTVDFLHVHQFPQNSDVEKSKIVRLVEKVQKFSPVKANLFIVPYIEFYKKASLVPQKEELIAFRRFLFHLGSAIAKKYHHLGLVTGDSIGQVASQTTENIVAADEASSVTVFRPLLTFNKQEIINIANKIDTFSISIEPYKDCCSLVTNRNPATKVPLTIAKKLDDKLGMADIVQKTLDQVSIIRI